MRDENQFNIHSYAIATHSKWCDRSTVVVVVWKRVCCRNWNSLLLREWYAVNQKCYIFYCYYLPVVLAAPMDFIVIVKINVLQNNKKKNKKQFHISRQYSPWFTLLFFVSVWIEKLHPFEMALNICFPRTNSTQCSGTKEKKINKRKTASTGWTSEICSIIFICNILCKCVLFHCSVLFCEITTKHLKQLQKLL